MPSGAKRKHQTPAFPTPHTSSSPPPSAWSPKTHLMRSFTPVLPVTTRTPDSQVTPRLGLAKSPKGSIMPCSIPFSHPSPSPKNCHRALSSSWSVIGKKSPYLDFFSGSFSHPRALTGTWLPFRSLLSLLSSRVVAVFPPTALVLLGLELGPGSGSSLLAIAAYKPFFLHSLSFEPPVIRFNTLLPLIVPVSS